MNKTLKIIITITLFFFPNLFLNSSPKIFMIERSPIVEIQHNHKNKQKVLSSIILNKISEINKKQNIDYYAKLISTYHYIRQKNAKKYSRKFNLISINYYCKKYFSVFNREFRKITDMEIVYKALIE